MDKEFLRQAIEKARESLTKRGFPAGAVIVKDGKVVGEGVSIGSVLHDPTSHGEVAAIRDACKNLGTNDLSGATLYGSLESCSMCLSASMWASVSKVVYACSKDKVAPEYYGGNYTSNALNKEFLKPLELVHLPELEEESLKLVKDWEMVK